MQLPQASIVLMGGTGTGKTTFLNLISGSKYLALNSLESCTDHVQPHQFIFENHDVTLVDMPGFDDTSKSDTDILTMIAEFLVKEYRGGRLLNGVMYFHRISDVRMSGTSRRNFTMFQKLCGTEIYENVALVTTRWDQEDEVVGMTRLEELKNKPQLFKPIIDGGGSVFKHDRSYDSACAILRHLIRKTPKPFLIQREIVVEGKEVVETAAGEVVQREVTEQVEKHEKEMAELMEEMANSRDESTLREMEEECRVLRERTTHLHGEAKKLAKASTAGKPVILTEQSANRPLETFTNTVGGDSQVSSGPPRAQTRRESVVTGIDVTKKKPVTKEGHGAERATALRERGEQKEADVGRKSPERLVTEEEHETWRKEQERKWFSRFESLANTYQAKLSALRRQLDEEKDARAREQCRMHLEAERRAWEAEQRAISAEMALESANQAKARRHTLMELGSHFTKWCFDRLGFNQREEAVN